MAPDQLVLENVPYIGDNWQAFLDGPQDLLFPSALGSVMKYLGQEPIPGYRYYLCISNMAYRQLWHPTKWDCPFDRVFALDGDPIEPIRRCFEAAGYEYRIVGNRELCAAQGLPLEGFDEYTDAAGLRQHVCASLQAGRPVIALNLHSGAAVVAGYEEGGEVAVGWTMVENETTAERDDLGYLRFRDWLARTPAVILIGARREALPLAEVCRKALTWAVVGARTPRTGEYASGLAAIGAWADALERGDGLRADDLEGLRQAQGPHFLMALALAEGRAFANDLTERAAPLYPEAAPELGAAEACWGMIHDLMWRVWHTLGTMPPDDAALARFADPAVRAELVRIARIARDKDAEAVAHLERALAAMGVQPGQLPPPADWEAKVVADAEARVQSSGANSDAVTWANGMLFAGDVPPLGFGRGRDCTFVGALEAALSTTANPFAYSDLMGYSGLAFATRWLDNPDQEPTPWGAVRWFPVGAQGEQPEALEALSRATGWRLRAAQWPEGDRLAQQRAMTDIVVSINAGLPVIAGCDTDLAVVHGYQIHGLDLLLRDYQHPDGEQVRLNSADPRLQPPFVFLEGLQDPLPLREALLASLAIAVRNGRREPADHLRYGLDALAAWRDALAAYDTCPADEQGLLFTVNWWSLMHLADARQAAAAFLAGNADLLTGDARTALAQAQSLYGQEAELLVGFADEHQDFITWWGGTSGVADWDAATRQRQQEVLAQAANLEQQALVALEEALVAEGREAH